MSHRFDHRQYHRAARLTLSLLLACATFAIQAPLQIHALSVNSIALTGSADTLTLAGALFAKTGAALTLALSTTSDARCVELFGDHSSR